MSQHRWTHSKSGDFLVKIDNEKNEMFICPEIPEAWFIPPGSKFKYKLHLDEYTEVKVILFSDGLSGLMPVRWTHKEAIQ